MRWITQPGFTGNLLATLAGALTVLSLAPYNIWPLVILSIAFIYIGLRELTPKQAMWRGWWYGFGLFATGTNWIYVSIHDFGGASPLLAGFLMLLFTAGVAWFFALPCLLWGYLLRNNRQPIIDAFTFAALWAGQEIFRGWFLTGFPWLYSGYSQLNGFLAGFAPIGGVWLVSFLLALTACLIIQIFIAKPKVNFIASRLIIIILIWGTGSLLTHYSWTVAKGNPLSVAGIQGNIAQHMKWDPEQLQEQLGIYRNMTINTPPADLIIWPETAVPVLKEHATNYLNVMDAFAKNNDSALITGIPIRQKDKSGHMSYYNAATALGSGSGVYLKQKLVPFGEYVPLQNLMRGLITFFNLPMSNFARGDSKQSLLVAKGHSIATYICYEVVYPEFASHLSAKSDLLLTISNDAWFGKSIGPLQHLQMAQFRALEAGRWMIRVTNNGITALIDPKGKIEKRIPSFSRGIIQGKVQPMQQLTPYLRWHSLPLLIMCMLIFSINLFYKKRILK
ncbi:UNVERIFIED_CONTAM: hypothetical protein GTU68_034666 [Idotea baltica]|nr:hypothetical protein [Idotea baltica]